MLARDLADREAIARAEQAPVVYDKSDVTLNNKLSKRRAKPGVRGSVVFILAGGVYTPALSSCGTIKLLHQMRALCHLPCVLREPIAPALCKRLKF